MCGIKYLVEIKIYYYLFNIYKYIFRDLMENYMRISIIYVVLKIRERNYN